VALRENPSSPSERTHTTTTNPCSRAGFAEQFAGTYRPCGGFVEAFRPSLRARKKGRTKGRSQFNQATGSRNGFMTVYSALQKPPQKNRPIPTKTKTRAKSQNHRGGLVFGAALDRDHDWFAGADGPAADGIPGNLSIVRSGQPVTTPRVATADRCAWNAGRFECLNTLSAIAAPNDNYSLPGNEFCARSSNQLLWGGK